MCIVWRARRKYGQIIPVIYIKKTLQRNKRKQLHNEIELGKSTAQRTRSIRLVPVGSDIDNFSRRTIAISLCAWLTTGTSVSFCRTGNSHSAVLPSTSPSKTSLATLAALSPSTGSTPAPTHASTIMGKQSRWRCAFPTDNGKNTHDGLVHFRKSTHKVQGEVATFKPCCRL